MPLLQSSATYKILFIDYAKAFDHVDHNTVIQKLKAFSVPDFIILWMSFLTARQQRVKLSEIFSDWITLNGGMLQGSYVGPVIFILLINYPRSWLHMHKFMDAVGNFVCFPAVKIKKSINISQSYS